MIVVRFKASCRPDRMEEALAAFADVIAPSRALAGVTSFDIGRDLADPNSIVAIEVFEDRDALARQESLPQVGAVLGLLGEIASAEPEATIFEVSSAAPHD